MNYLKIVAKVLSCRPHNTSSKLFIKNYADLCMHRTYTCILNIQKEISKNLFRQWRCEQFRKHLPLQKPLSFVITEQETIVSIILEKDIGSRGTIKTNMMFLFSIFIQRQVTCYLKSNLMEIRMQIQSGCST